MIYTSNYKDCKYTIYNTCSISGDKGKDARYEGKCYSALAPKKEFWDQWKKNIGTVPELENNKYYIREYWKQVLSNLQVEKVYNDLNNNILLCYEDNMDFCHRHIVAAWFELLLDVEVIEVSPDKTKFNILEKPSYIKEYLEEVMKEKDMRGFNSLRALYLFEKSELMEEKSNELMSSSIETSEWLKEEAEILKDTAYDVETCYNNENKILIKK